MMRQTTLDEAQIWRRYSEEKPVRSDFRYSERFPAKNAGATQCKRNCLRLCYKHT